MTQFNQLSKTERFAALTDVHPLPWGINRTGGGDSPIRNALGQVVLEKEIVARLGGRRAGIALVECVNLYTDLVERAGEVVEAHEHLATLNSMVSAMIVAAGKRVPETADDVEALAGKHPAEEVAYLKRRSDHLAKIEEKRQKTSLQDVLDVLDLIDESP